VQLLIEHGADVAAQTEDGLTPLYLATKKGHVELAKFLTEHGGDATS
jgi:ankyrin repeat protein